ncbi:GNAT family N-acetyltransferase [Leeia aquatica]|uniref:GNAT family N-acetyltransferase n=1 Tax=Leeia aquatica TaxID=2725557 RepID=A0A847SHB6_9NEIS|nr:GNAT family N-acetyltransferase [Leeia aquatica]NLR76688.1 GNAT family N-acetyltransferase [Leeia aquatica]
MNLGADHSHQLEQLAAAAWPARQQQVMDGWLWREHGGYTKRANSAWLLDATDAAHPAALDRVEARYRALGLRPLFKLTEHTPQAVVQQLDARGYTCLDESLVMYRHWTQPATAHPAVQISPACSDAWLAATSRLLQLSDQGLQLASILQALPPSLYAWVTHGDEVIAVGLGVVQGDHIGFCDLITAPTHRRQGWARAIVDSLQAHAWQHGVRHGWLQVVADNQGARALYQQTGFHEGYRYVYRQAPQATQ